MRFLGELRKKKTGVSEAQSSSGTLILNSILGSSTLYIAFQQLKSGGK
jgi:hypothetical protein